MARQIEAFQSDGKGGVKKVLIDEPDDVKIERERSERLQVLAQREDILEKLDQLDSLIQWAESMGYTP
jgi:hypothetical protein